MTKKAKKLLAVILSAILILSVVPLSVFTAAAESVTGYISAPLLSLGVTTNVSYDGTETSGAFRFCPDSSGVYILNSKGYLDTYVRVLDENGNQIGSDDSGGENLNFQLNLNLESGKKYYLLTRLYDASSSGNYEIIITESPVERIEVEDVSIIEGTSGYYNSSWNGSEFVEYWYYSWFYPSFTVHFKDKTSKTVERGNSGTEIDGTWYYLSTTDNQSYDNQWTVGNSYTVDCTFMGVKSSFNVNITESPVERIEVEDVSIMEGTSGHSSRDWNGSGYVEYWRYIYSYPALTIYFKDKTSKTVEKGSGGTEIDGTRYYLSTTDNQSYDNQWTVGNSYTVDCTFMGVKSSFNVNITENPVDWVEIEDVSIIERSSGEIKTDTDENEYWYYRFTAPNYTVHLKDGTAVKGNGAQLNYDNYDSWGYGSYVEIYGNNFRLYGDIKQSDNHWEVGNTYTVPCTFAGVECSFNVNITESPVERIEVEDVSIMEGTSGYYNRGWNGSEFVEYWCYSSYPAFTIYFKDKTSKTVERGNSGTEIDGTWYYLSTTDNQSYDNQWTVGNSYTVDCTFMGVKSSFNVTVIERPDFEYFEQDGGVIITNYYKQDENIEIPAEISGKPVIGVNYLGYCNFKSVTIPASVKFLSDGAFYKDSLENIFVSPDNEYYSDVDGVLTNKAKTKIIVYPLGKGNIYTVPAGILDVSVFDDWHYENVSVIFDESQFTNIDGVLYTKDMKTVVKCESDVSGSYTMPDTVTEIVPKAFAECDKITDVKISSNVTEITYAAFAGCSSMASIDLPEGLTSIGESAFLNSGLTGANVPNTVTEICYNAFFGCEKLESVSLSQNITEIKGGTFSRCSSLKAIDVPGKVTKIGVFAFSNCSSLSQVTLPQSLESIDDCAFWFCSDLGSIDLPDSLLSIGDSAFASSGLTSISIPDRVISVRLNAFSGCTKLKNVNIGKGLSYIDDSVFSGCSALESVTIPQNIQKIYRGAFSGCSSLKTVTFQNDDVEIYSYAFAGCDLTNTKLPKRLKALNSGVLMGTNIENIEIPNTVTDIVYRSLGYCEKLTSIYIPSSVTKIGDYVLCGCTGIESISVDDSNPNYYDKDNCIIETDSKTLIAGCKNSIIPADGSVTSIAEGAFGDLTNLTSITIPAAITNIGYDSFAGCGGLESITVDEDNTVYHSDGNCLIDTEQKAIIRGCINSKIPADGSVTRIGYWAFSGCGDITSIVIPDSITRIDYDAFYGCSGLTDIYYTGTEEQRKNMYLDYNEELENATWHYNCNPDNPTCEHKQSEVRNAKAVTCTEDGYTGDTYCKLCDMKLSSGEVIPATGHNYVWKTVKIATETENGIKEKVCSRCGEKTGRTEPIAYTGHITGDINGDRIVNNKDIIRLFQYLSGWDVTVNQSALDINGDGDINNKDITRLFKYLSGWAVEIK